MSSPETPDVEALFDIALGLHDEDREQYVRLVELGDRDLGKALLTRLKAYQQFDLIMEADGGLSGHLDDLGIGDGLQGDDDPTIIPGGVTLPRAIHELDDDSRDIKGFTIVGKIAEGGQGTVFLAKQDDPKRTVALKVMHGTDFARGREFNARFTREYSVLARMNHNNIARIYGTGMTREGFPYFYMEHIAGGTITQHCRENNLHLDQRLALFEQVLAGVAHAHRKLILHRDLKPSNILITEEGEHAMAKIIDFGIAKNLGDEEPSAFKTRVAWIGTPQYMAPEQLGDARAVPDLRMDVYALGVILYELICDSQPHASDRMDKLPPDEQFRILREDEPTRPSNRLRKDGKQEILREYKEDLDWIVGKAMAKEPEKRYESVSDLAADIRAFRERRPVRAKPPGFFYVAGKFIQRNRLMVSLAALVTTLILGLLIQTIFAKAEAEQAGARFGSSFNTLEALLTAPHEQGIDTRIVDILELGVAELDQTQDPELEAMMRTLWGNTYFGLTEYASAKDQLNTTLAVYESRGQKAEASRTRYYLGRVHNRLEQYEEAETLLREAYQAQRANGLTLHALDSLTELSFTLTRLDRDEEAMTLMSEQVERSALLPEGPGRARFLVTYAQARDRLDKGDALVYAKASVRMSETHQGPTHPNTLAAKSNLAALYLKQADFKTAEALYQNVYSTRLDKYGGNHDRTLEAGYGLLKTLERMSKPDQALTLAEELRNGFKGKHSRYPQVVRVQVNILARNKRLDEAETIVRALKDSDRLSAYDKSILFWTLANGYKNAGNDKQAEAILKETLANMGDPTKNINNRSGMEVTLGEIYEARGLHTEAAKWFAAGVNRRLEAGTRNARTGLYKILQARNLAKLGRIEDAEILLQTAKDLIGSRHQTELNQAAEVIREQKKSSEPASNL